MTAQEAVMGTSQIALPNPASPKPNFTATPAQGGVQVKFDDGRRMFVPQAQFEQLMNIRMARTKAMQQPQQGGAQPYTGPQVSIPESIAAGMAAGG